MKKTKSTVNKSTPQALSLRQLAGTIGVDVGLLSRESKRLGFPSQTVKGKTVFLAEQVLAWRAANVRQRKLPPAATASTAPTPQAAQPAISAEDDALLRVLTSGTASALEITRAAMQIAGRRVARAETLGHLGVNDLDALKKSLQELRAAEASYLELKKSLREVIERAQVCSIMTSAVSRLIRVLSTVENSIATEFSLWLADPKIQAMGSEERSRTVREFVQRTTADARRMEAQSVEALIAAAARDD